MTKCEHGTPACSSCYEKQNYEGKPDTVKHNNTGDKFHDFSDPANCWCSGCTQKAAKEAEVERYLANKAHPMAGFPTPHISGLAPLAPLKPHEELIKKLVHECIAINAYLIEQQKANKFSHEHMITLTVANNESFALLIKEVGNT